LAIATLVLDAFKGWLPVFLVLTLPIVHASTPGQLHTLATFAALMAVIGHMFPVWLGFKGGKGVATGLGVFLALAPKAVLIAVVLFLAIVVLTRYVSLGSILAAAAFPAALWWLERDSFPAPALAMCAAVALLVIIRHHQNIGRLLAGTESRFGARKA
jgi:glycerol-3-phosphate acyltransferase PlsY